jgi:HEAT repeats
MSRGDTRWIVTGSLVLLTGVTVLALQHRSHRRGAAAAEEAAAAQFRLAAGPLGPSGAGMQPANPAPVKPDVAGAMSRWRTAVVSKDAETVIALDVAFRQKPDLYAPALAKIAEAEGNERVRAFSTRVLGKLRDPALAPLYERLLADESVYVRQNAAWSLGELGAGGDGRAAAEHAVTELQHVRARDPANEVRLAAKDALNKLE